MGRASGDVCYEFGIKNAKAQTVTCVKYFVKEDQDQLFGSAYIMILCLWPLKLTDSS